VLHGEHRGGGAVGGIDLGVDVFPSRMADSIPRTLPASWAYLADFILMSSPNHFACSCASA
jgi:hypothetical protein